MDVLFVEAATGTVAVSPFLVGGTEIIVLIRIFLHAPQIYPLFAVGTENQSGEDIGFSRGVRFSSALKPLLHHVENPVFHNRFVGILENQPIGAVVMNLLLQLIGFGGGFVIRCCADIRLIDQYPRSVTS